MTTKTIWMPLYIGDYLRDTSRLNTEQHGAYLLLMMDYYINGCLPDDDSILARVAQMSESRWRSNKTAIAPFFFIKNGVWWHNRIEKELDVSTKLRERNQKNGKKGGRPQKAKKDEGGAK